MSGLLAEELDLLLAVSSLVVFCAFVYVVLTILEHAIDQAGQAMGHRSDGFRGTELAAQSSVLRTEVGWLFSGVDAPRRSALAARLST